MASTLHLLLLPWRQVERAYELLVENEDGPSMDDFAEQCRIVAEKEDEDSDDDFDDDFDDDD